MAALLLIGTAACSSPASGGTPVPHSSSAPATSAAAEVRQLPQGCSDDEPCTFPAGRAKLGVGTVLERLELTLPSAGWTSTANDQQAFDLQPPGASNEHFILWIDMLPVKSTAKGHTWSTLTKVGKKPAALLAWLDGNKDLTVKKLPDRSIAGIAMQGRSVTASPASRNGGQDCPVTPRCADLFAQGRYETDGYWSVDYPETYGLYIGGPIKEATNVIVALDAPNEKALADLQSRMSPVLDSMTLH